jgi:flagellar protein FlaJ
MSMLFFHAVTLQAVVAGLVSGYMRDSSLLSGMKYVVGLLGVSLLVWLVVG